MKKKSLVTMAVSLALVAASVVRGAKHCAPTSTLVTKP